MSIKVPLDCISQEIRKGITKDLCLRLETNKYVRNNSKTLELFHLEGDTVILPFAYASSKVCAPRPTRNSFRKMDVKFTANLYEEQMIIRKEAINHLNKTGSVILSVYMGGGKTAMSINVACSIKLPTLILVHNVNMIGQWAEEIAKFCPAARVQKLSSKCDLEESDFYVMYAPNAAKKPRNFFKSIGCFICDETHLLLAEKVSESHKNIFPRYMIGLSATPYRMDDLNCLIPIYYGTNQIVRELYHEHTVYKVNTGFKPSFDRDFNGKMIWGTLLESQANDLDRNALIVSIVKKFKERNFLILVKRVSQGEHLLTELRNNNEHTTSLLGDQQEFDKSARILIGTGQKISTGFSHSKMDTLLLAADVQQYFIQILGRVFRRKDVKPIIFDLVDVNSTLERHFKTRKEVYEKTGGKISKYNA